MRSKSARGARRDPLPRNDRGSAMLAALCLAIVFTICLTSFLALSFTSVRMSTRHTMGAHAAEVAEAGLELALYTENNEPTWPGWTVAGGNASATFTMTAAGLVLSSTSPAPLNFGNGSTVQVTVNVTGIATTAPVFSSAATATLPNDLATVTRTLSATGAPAPVFVNALAATGALSPGTVNFAANATVDSYDSGTAAPYTLGYSAVVLSQKNSAGSGATVLLTNSAVQGYTCGSDFDSPNTTNWLSYAGSGKVVGAASGSLFIDSSRLITNPLPYQPLFPEIPQGGATTTTIDNTLANVLIGLAGGSTVYSVPNVILSGTFPMVISGHVTLYVSGDFEINPLGPDLCNIIFNDVLPGKPASLEVHMTSSSGNVIINGSPLLGNTPLALSDLTAVQAPRLFSIEGTNDTTGTIRIATTNPVAGTFYFPNNLVTIAANTVLYGSVVAGAISVPGSAAVHYDIALRTPLPVFANDPAFHAFVAPIALGRITESPLP